MVLGRWDARGLWAKNPQTFGWLLIHLYDLNEVLYPSGWAQCDRTGVSPLGRKKRSDLVLKVLTPNMSSSSTLSADSYVTLNSGQYFKGQIRKRKISCLVPCDKARYSCQLKHGSPLPPTLNHVCMHVFRSSDAGDRVRLVQIQRCS
jgi:hypothetical protein